MTAFANTSFDTAPIFTVPKNPLATRWAVDEAVRENRKNTPPEVVEQRKEPRYSIEEINRLDIGTLAKRFENRRYDRRPKVVKALDMVDLPRNLIANIVFPNAAAMQARDGERATFGLPRVMFSDALKTMGVENKVVRGIVGFAGDIALDPLTYLGGTGAGLRLTTTAGKGGEIVLSKTGRTVLNNSIKTATRGGTKSIKDDAAREMFRGLGVDDAAIRRFEREAIEAGEDVASSVEGRIRAAVLGDIQRPRVAGVLRPIGFDSRVGSSPIADAFRELNDPVQKFVARYQRGSTQLPGFATAGARLDGAGSELFHIPFTDIAFRTRGFTAAGHERGAISALSRAGKASPMVTEQMAKATQGAAVAKKGIANLSQLLEDTQTARDMARAGGIRPTLGYDQATKQIIFEPPTLADDMVSENIRQIREIQDEVATTVGGLLKNVQTAQKTIPVEQLTVDSMLANVRVGDQLKKEYGLADAAFKSAKQDRAVVEGLRTDRASAIAERARQIIKTDTPVTDADMLELDTLWKSYGGELSDIQSRMMDLSDQEFEAFSAHIDVIANRIHAVRAANEAAMRPVYAGLTSEERVILDVAKHLLGTTSDVQGSMVLGPISRAIEDRLGEDSKVVSWMHAMMRASRKAFGDRGGSIYHEIRRYNATSGVAMQRFIETEGSRMRDALRLKTSDVIDAKAFNAHFDEIDELVQNIATAKLADGSPNGFHLHEFDGDATDGILRGADGVPVSSAWARKIQAAQTSGILSEKQYPSLKPILEQHADELISKYDELALAGDEDLALVAREVYLPNTITPELRQQIRRRRAAGPDRAVVGKQSDAITENFQRRKSTDQTRFPVQVKTEAGITTKWKRFFEWQRAYVDDAEFGDKSLIARFGEGSPEIESIRAIRETIKQYDSLDDATRAKYQARPTSSAELNEMVDKGRFELLTNRAELKRSAFEVGASQVWANRLAQQQRANAKKSLVDILGQHGFLIDRKVWGQVLGTNGEFVIPNGNPFGGIKASLVQTGKDSAPVIKIGDQRFRPLNTQVINGDGDLLSKGLFDEDIVAGQVGVYPERIAEQIERVFEAFQAPGSMQAALNTVDDITGWWKSVTLFHPSWMVGNATSTVALAMAAGVRPDELGRNFRDATKMTFARGAKGLDRVFTIGGQKMTAEDVLANAVEHGIIGSNYTTEASARLVANGTVRLSDNRVVQGMPDRWRDAHETMSQAERLSKVPAAKRIGQTSLFLKDQGKAMMGGWFKINAMFEDSMRLATYIALRNKGLSDNDAARRVITNLFDYQDLTRLERDGFKRAIPFYVWLKNSLVHQVGLALEHPWYAGLTPKVKEALEESFLGDAQVPEHHRPAWLREQMAIQIGADPNSRWAFTVGSLLPQEQLLRTMAAFTGPEGAMDYANFFMAGVNPIARVPIEAAFGREAFTDRSIGPTSTTGELSLAEHLAGQVRPLREFGSPASIRRGAVPAAFDRSFGEGVGRITLGGRIQPFNEDRIGFNNRREIQEAEQNIRRAIRISVREGSDHDGRTARLELLRLYDAALSLGFDDIVPKWAQRQLAEIKGVSDSAD